MSQLAAQQQAPQSSQHKAAAQTDDALRSMTNHRSESATDAGGAVLMEAPAAEPVEASMPAMSKKEAADAVKNMIKPLYKSQQLSKEQFKAIAQSCTHTLADPAKRAGCSPKTVVQDFMKEIGLGRQASYL